MLENGIGGLIWIIVGTATAIIYLQFQKWTVHQLNPHNPRWSLRLIIGGTILRWVLVAVVLTFAVTSSFSAMITVFASFMIIRLFYLLKWQGWLLIRNTNTNQF